MYKLILASQSPRRKQLLTEAGFSFAVLPTQVSETPSKNLNPQDQIIELARRKSRACLDQNKHLISQEFLVLASDTEVILDGAPMGKPENEEMAKLFLSRLSGRSHRVITGLSLVNCKTNEEVSNFTETEIFFKKLTSEEIDEYVATRDPFDKAGGYGIQGHAGRFVEKIVGPFDNVVGMPVDSFRKLLSETNWELTK